MGSGVISATVMWLVALMNRRNSATVTGCWSIQKPPTLAVWTGLSSG